MTIIERPLAWQTAAMARSAGVIVVGYAKVPSGASVRAHHDTLSIILRVDRASGLVTDVDSTAVTALVRGWLVELLIGLDLNAPVDDVLHVIDRDYLGPAAPAIRQAVHDAWRRWAHHGAPS
jgi:uncharacterized protein DUF3870